MKKCLPFLLFISVLLSEFQAYTDNLSLNRNQFYIGPEWYYLTRSKEGGTEQNGNLFGGRIGYDRLKRFGVYWGADASYAQGTIKGHTGMGSSIKSNFTDASVEGRAGYTFQQKDDFQMSITPYAGLGYFMEKNNFIEPSPIHIHFNTRFVYAAAGFLSWMHLCDAFEVGVNFKVKYPFSPRCKVTNDPDHDGTDQRIGTRLQYRVDLPLTYRLTCSGNMALSAIPFFEYRNYGSHSNFPFNFISTRIKSWGVTLEYLYRL